MDPFSLVTGALLVAVAYTVGRARGVREGRKKSQPQAPPAAVCGCSHPPGMHVNKTGECKFAEWNSWDERMDRCPCQAYDGPEPLPTFYAPPITEN